MVEARQGRRKISCPIVIDQPMNTTCFPLPERCSLIAASGNVNAVLLLLAFIHKSTKIKI